MPKGKWIDKKNATTFQLVYRPQNDPLIHDESAPQMVLNPVQQRRAGSSKVKRLDDLASELGSDTESIRANEGEAANYGIYFDDTQYDYMQHLRDLNSGGGGAVWVEAANSNSNKNKGKSLEAALKELELEQKSAELLDDDLLPSKNLQRLTYQSQQDIPDSIAGFQPDMDPRLREVLEALEDEEYIDDNDDVFQELSKDARELNDHEFEEQDFDDDDGWESDDTAKPAKEFKDDEAPELVDTSIKNGSSEGATHSQDWMEDFNKFKKDQKVGKSHPAAAAPSELQSSIWTTTTNGGRRKKRKGALTNPSTYSMTSSSLMRTEQLELLDNRFEKIQEDYMGELEDDMGSVSAISTASSVQGPTRTDFNGILDDFLEGYAKSGKGASKKARAQSGVEQLDEIRRELGPAKIRSRS